MDSMRFGQNGGEAEPIEIAPAPNLYLVEFVVGRQQNDRISVILPATCQLDARLKAWELFPEHRRVARRTSVLRLKYVEIDWQTGRTVVVKDKRRPAVPNFSADEVRKLIERKKREEGMG